MRIKCLNWDKCDGDFYPVDPSARYFEALLGKREWEFPPLKPGGAEADR
jgi:hypothetical protein